MLRTVHLRESQVAHQLTIHDDGTIGVDGATPLTVRVRGDGEVRVGDGATAWTVSSGETKWVFFNGEVFEIELQTEGRTRRAGGAGGSLSAPMPASVVRVDVRPGDVVRQGATLVILEAMKMELPVRAPADGTVRAVHCKPGDLVQPGVPLIEIA
jgi:biotin carboxyl carrier protein